MLDRSLRDLSFAGWLLALSAIAIMVLVSIPVGRWALDELGTRFLRENKGWLMPALAIAGLASGVAFFWIGARILRTLDIPLARDRER